MRFTDCTKTHRPVTNSLNASCDDKSWGHVIIGVENSNEVAKNQKEKNRGEKSLKIGCKQKKKKKLGTIYWCDLEKFLKDLVNPKKYTLKS